MTHYPTPSLFAQGKFPPVAHARAVLAPTDPNVRPADVPRLTGQNAAVLDRLKRGPATAAELAALSLKYTSRISDLRAAGYKITHDPTCGTYTLVVS